MTVWWTLRYPNTPRGLRRAIGWSTCLGPYAGRGTCRLRVGCSLVCGSVFHISKTVCILKKAGMLDFGETDLGNRPTKHTSKGHISGWALGKSLWNTPWWHVFMFPVSAWCQGIDRLRYFRGTSQLNPHLLKEAPPKKMSYLLWPICVHPSLRKESWIKKGHFKILYHLQMRCKYSVCHVIFMV